MYNKYIKEEIFPKKLKTAQVIHVYKKNSKCECANYRPISILESTIKYI